MFALAVGLILGAIFYGWWARHASSGRLKAVPRYARVGLPIAVGVAVVSIAVEPIRNAFFVMPLIAMVIAGFDLAFLGGLARARRIESRRDDGSR